MLVLSRRREERIMVGDDIVLKVVSVRGDTVRIGIEAPLNLPVHREEVYTKILKKNGGSLQKTLPKLGSKDEFEFCSKALATQHYDFNYEEWVAIDHAKAARFDCQLYRREVSKK